MDPEPRHLAPWAPRTSWDGWFAIAIFPPGSEIRWLKAHFYRRAGGGGRTSLAAIEGLDKSSETLLAWGKADGTSAFHRAVDPAALKASQVPLRVELADRFLLKGNSPNYEMRVNLPEDGAGVTFHADAGWPIWWARVGRALHYVGQHSQMRIELAAPDGKKTLEGFGALEHACGISLPLDVAKLAVPHWHWDVLAFHSPGSPYDSAAGLSIGRKGTTRWRVKAAARLPGYGAGAMRGLSIRYLEMGSAKDPEGNDVAIPLRWEGSMRNRLGTFRYEAAASTPMAPLVPAGGFLGFDFEGEWTPASGQTRTWGGTGFTEYGDRAGHLLRLAR